MRFLLVETWICKLPALWGQRARPHSYRGALLKSAERQQNYIPLLNYEGCSYCPLITDRLRRSMGINATWLCRISRQQEGLLNSPSDEVNWFLFFFLSSKPSKQMFSGSPMPTLQQPATVSVNSHLTTFEPGNQNKAVAPTADGHLFCHWRRRVLTEVVTCDHSGPSHQCSCCVLCVMCARVHTHAMESKIKQESRSLSMKEKGCRVCTDGSISYLHKLYHQFLCFDIFKAEHLLNWQLFCFLVALSLTPAHLLPSWRLVRTLTKPK